MRPTTSRSSTRSCLTFAMLLCLLSATVLAGVPAEKVPPFQVRFRAAQKPELDDKPVTFTPGRSKKSVRAATGEWSDWIEVDKTYLEAALGRYPNSYSRTWPVRLMFSVRPVPAPLEVTVEAKIQDQSWTSGALLTGRRLGLAVWREDDGSPRVTTLGEYNRRKYWSVVRQVDAPGRLPTKIQFADRFIPGDSDRRALTEGFAGLRELGMNVLMVNPHRGWRELAREVGFRKITWAVYNPPGYAFDFGGEKTSLGATRRWARKLRAQYTDAGFSTRDFAFYTISDEPGFYYPSTYRRLNGNERYLQRFHEYLRQRDLTPADLGCENWEEVRAKGRSQATSLPRKRLFYWTQRFFPHESARFFARARRAMEQAFYPGMPAIINWNFFAGRCYFPGDFANNPDKGHPDAAMAGHDWFEFCRLGGTRLPWTEDWFGDEKSFQWSYYAEKLWSASMSGEFGGYVIPRTAGSMDEGIGYKILSLVGHGARTVKFFTFGPEYNFPGNCYSQNPRVFAPMARAIRMVGGAEELLYPGRPVPREVGLLHHLSAEMWDQWEDEKPSGIVDATNTDMNARATDYTAELYDVYLALMHSQVPVEFLSEEDATWGALDHLKVIYVVEPNVPRATQNRLLKWVKDGGTLVTTASAGAFDRYNERCKSLDKARGATEAPHERLAPFNIAKAADVGTVTGDFGTFTAWGARTELQINGAEVLAAFDDGDPAIITHDHGEGRMIHYALLPGISYRKPATGGKGRFPEGFPEAARTAITLPVRETDIRRPVILDRPMVEAPVLASPKGLAITLLNWTNPLREDLTVRIPTDRTVNTVRSVRRGELEFTHDAQTVEFQLPLKTTDIILVEYD